MLKLSLLIFHWLVIGQNIKMLKLDISLHTAVGSSRDLSKNKYIQKFEIITCISLGLYIVLITFRSMTISIWFFFIISAVYCFYKVYCSSDTLSTSFTCMADIHVGAVNFVPFSAIIDFEYSSFIVNDFLMYRISKSMAKFRFRLTCFVLR